VPPRIEYRYTEETERVIGMVKRSESRLFGASIE
jgi:hypothetical protein